MGIGKGNSGANRYLKQLSYAIILELVLHVHFLFEFYYKGYTRRVLLFLPSAADSFCTPLSDL